MGLHPILDFTMMPNRQVAGANRRWRLQFRYRGSRRESAVAQLFSLIWLNKSQAGGKILFRFFHGSASDLAQGTVELAESRPVQANPRCR